MENLLNLSDAAKYLGIHKETISKWGKTGKVTITRDKYNVKYVSLDEIEKFKVPPGMKKCSKCEFCKKPEDFSPRQSVCKTCRAKPYQPRLIDGEWTKKCLVCNIIKSTDDFYSKTKCRQCKRDQSKAWKENNPERVEEYTKQYREDNKEKMIAYDKKKYAENRDYRRAQNMCWQYKITMEELENLKKKANGKCAICHTEDFKLCLDHNHSTNKPREFLCSGCNFGIGAFKENIESLKNAIMYLERHSTEPSKFDNRLFSGY